MGNYIDTCINSILNEDLYNLEVIVVDDGSTDCTKSIVKKYTEKGRSKYDPRVVYIYQENAGKSCAVNHGFFVARGRYLTIVDADDRIPSCGITSRYRAVEEYTGGCCDLSIGAFEVFDREHTYGTRKPPETSDPERLHDQFYLRWKTPFHLNAGLFSQELVERVGGLDESLHRCIDGDYALRLLKEAESVRIIDDVVYRYRKHRSSPLDRLKYRLKTARYRPQVIWKNYQGWRRWLGVPFGLAMDAGKLMYEIASSYKK